MAKDNNLLGNFQIEFKLRGIPPAPRGVQQIEVTTSTPTASLMTRPWTNLRATIAQVTCGVGGRALGGFG